MAAALANFTPQNVAAGFVLPSSAARPLSGLAAYTPAWKAEIARMRARTVRGADNAGPGRAGDQDGGGRADGRGVYGADILS